MTGANGASALSRSTMPLWSPMPVVLSRSFRAWQNSSARAGQGQGQTLISTHLRGNTHLGNPTFSEDDLTLTLRGTLAVGANTLRWQSVRPECESHEPGTDPRAA